jgi:hypothetical protein
MTYAENLAEYISRRDAKLGAHATGRQPTTADESGGETALAVRLASTITPRPIKWLWRPRIPAGRYIELVGYPGVGKTTVVCDVIAHLTTGKRWPDGAECEPCRVVIGATEDAAEDVLVPRLLAAGADLSLIHFVDGIKRGELIEDLDLSRVLDFHELIKLITKTRAALMYLDALDDALGTQHDGTGNAGTRRALAPLRVLAKTTGVAVLGTRHPSKRVAVGPALNSGNGSIAYAAVARGSLLLTADPNDADRRLLFATKNNLSVLAATLSFRLLSDHEDGQPRIVWGAQADPRTADDVLAALRAQEQRDRDDVGGRTKLAGAAEVICEWLGDGWMPVKELDRLSHQRGIAPKTLRRAKEELRLQYHRVGFGPGSEIYCALRSTSLYSPTIRELGK